MNASRFAIPALALLLCAHGAPAQTISEETLQRMQQQIRKDRFDHVLPRAMRDNNVDMWIHVVRDRNPDPIARDLGGESGVFVFTDRGGDRIERAILGMTDEALWEDEAYDLFAGEEAFEGDAGWQPVDRRLRGRAGSRAHRRQLRAAESPGRRHLPHGLHELLKDALGEKYAARIVSAEGVISDFVAGIVVGEIALAGYFGMLTMQTLDEEFAKIEVGVTRLEDLDGNVFVRDADGNENNGNEYVLQPGDLITILNGAGEGYFVADLGGNGYLLQEGETELPPRVRRIWHHAMQVREILRANIRIGPTAGETLALLIEKLEEAGFLYVDEDRYDPTLDPTKTQVHLDLHAQGRRDMDAPRISPLGGDWQRNMKLPLFHSFTLEYMVHMPVPEWGPREAHVHRLPRRRDRHPARHRVSLSPGSGDPAHPLAAYLSSPHQRRSRSAIAASEPWSDGS